MQKITKAAELLALIIMAAFTGTTISMAIHSRGALVYYYEPHPIILLIEVVLSVFAVCVGVWMMYELFKTV